MTTLSISVDPNPPDNLGAIFFPIRLLVGERVCESTIRKMDDRETTTTLHVIDKTAFRFFRQAWSIPIAVIHYQHVIIGNLASTQVLNVFTNIDEHTRILLENLDQRGCNFSPIVRRMVVPRQNEGTYGVLQLRLNTTCGNLEPGRPNDGVQDQSAEIR